MERQTRFDVVAVGEVLMDMIAPDATDLASATTFLRAPGGAPANVAVAAARLGARSAFVGAAGQDPFGDVLADLLVDEGVNTEGLRRTRERTTLAVVAANRGGIPRFEFYRGSDAALRTDDIPAAIVGATAFVYVSSMALMSEPSAGATQYAAELAREFGGLVAVDPNLRPSSWGSTEEMIAAAETIVRGADVLKINDEEAALLAGTRDPSLAAQQLGDENALVVITLGDRGCLWQWAGHQDTVPAPSVTIADTTGAGDAFMGALLCDLAQAGFDPRQHDPLAVEAVRAAVRFATAAGAAACTHTGAMSALPTRAQVQELA